VLTLQAPPVFTACPAMLLTANTAPGLCSAVVTYTVTATGDPVPTISHSFNGAPSSPGTGSGSSFQLGVTSVLITAANPCGMVTCSFTVTVTDNQPPVITCPANIVKAADPGQCSAVVSYNVTASDNCAYTLTQTNGFPSGSAFAAGLNVVNWKVTDAGGNTTACSFSITVNDLQNPSIVCPATISRNTDPGQCSTVVTYANPTFSDNCSQAALTRTSGLASGAAFPKGITMVNWKATDAAGNTAICGFTVTVTDGQAPTIICPANLVKSTDAGQCTAVVTYSTPTFADNCLGASVTRTGGPASGTVFPKGPSVVTWKATDAAGLMATCSFTVTVNDNQTPTITCPANQAKSTDPNLCTAVVTYTAPAFTDNCPGGSVAIQSGLASGTAFPKGINTVIWRATDAAGLTKTCTFRVTVNDTQAPTITCPANQVKTTDANLCSAATTYTDATFTDNCTGGSVVKLSGLNSGSAFLKGVNNVVFKATDAAGNQSLCTMTVTVTDARLPVVTCPANIAVTGTISSGVCSATVTYTTPAATDNCGILSNYLLSGLASGSVFPEGITTHVWKTTDHGGLTQTCAFTVAVSCGTGLGSEELAVRSEEFEVRSSNFETRITMNLVPNPAATEVTISVEGIVPEAGSEISVFDVQGRIMWQRTMKADVLPVYSFPLSLSEFPSGLYFVTLRSDGAVVTKRLVVSKL